MRRRKQAVAFSLEIKMAEREKEAERAHEIGEEERVELGLRHWKK